MASSHTLQFSLYSTPVGFNILGMYTSGGINELKGMIYHFMVESWKPLDLTVCSPLIRMDNCVWCSMSSYDGQESGSITSRYNLHVP